MENYCDGWSQNGNLCAAQLGKLVSNAVLVGLALPCLYFLSVAKKRLVRYWLHDLHYSCILTTLPFIIFEIIAWHAIYGGKTFLILNSVYQVFGVFATVSIYSGGERTATRYPLFFLNLSYLAMLCSHALETVSLIHLMGAVGSPSDVDIRVYTSVFRLLMYSILTIITTLNLVKGHEEWTRVATRDTSNKHWTAALPSKLTFAWMQGLLVQGWRKPLEMSDVGQPPQIDKCAPLCDEFQTLWEEESKKESPSLIFVCLRLFKGTYIMSIVMRVVGDCVLFGSPFAVAGINLYIIRQQAAVLSRGESEETQEPLPDQLLPLSEFVNNGFVLVFYLLIAGLLNSILSSRYSMFMNFWRAVHVRSLLQFMCFKKALRLAPWANKDPDLTQGKILNVMSTDTVQYHFMFYFVNFMCIAPIMIIGCIVLLLVNMGWPALVGIFILFASFPINGIIAKKMGTYQRKVMGLKDQRMKLMNEMLLGIKSIKMYGWESVLKGMIAKARKKELDVIRKQMGIRAIFIFVANIIPTLMACAIFVLYSVSAKEDPVTGERGVLTTYLALSTLALLGILRMPFIMIPVAIGATVNGRACAQRIMKFLAAPELDEDSSALTVPLEDSPNAVEFRDTTLAWGVDANAADALTDLNVQIPRGKLTVVVGEVGSGKSAFISAFINEMHIKQGEVVRNVGRDKISYAAQSAWILNSTVKENIIFGHPLDEARYKEVCDVCCLEMDLKNLAAGDQTEIGERGVNLSGGQRQRVSVARALYAFSDLVLLDDPLSALDAHVGSKLFERGIRKFLARSGRTVVLITHHLQYLNDADLVIEIDEGRVSYWGDHTKYESESSFYKNFLANLAHKEKETRERALSETEIKRQVSAVELIEKEKAALMSQEDRETGAVRIKVYMTWAKAAGPTLVITLLMILLSNVARIGVDYWTTVWTEKQIPSWTDDTYYIATYIGAALLSGVLVFIGYILIVFDGIRASQRLFNEMLDRVMRATPRFFDTTPLGRIVSRFSNDVVSLDTALVETVSSAISLISRVTCVIIMQVITSYFFGIAIIPIFLIYYLVQTIYITTSRELQRLDSISKSPIMAFFSETLGGLPTVRAYMKCPSFLTRMEKYVDQNTNTFMLTNMANNWVGFRLDLIGVIVTTISGLVCVIASSQQDSNGQFLISASQAGLALTFALTLPGELNWMLTNVSMTELSMNAVERIKNYASQPPVESDSGDRDPGPSWPKCGAISFQNYTASYDEELDNVLNDISIEIPAGKRVGICGRTGSGKSSLTIALFRMLVSKGGCIKIDDIDLNDLPLKKLRDTLTIIPQDPLLFAGPIRYNLDPTGTLSDEEVWSALERVNMKETIKSYGVGLDLETADSGENFSVGQRQLLCLARAFLRNSKIVIMDEATASIDLETDQKIQKVIRSEFQGATMLIIAHRISSISDSDLILVLEKGRIAEYASPQVLQSNSKSLFSKLITSNVL